MTDARRFAVAGLTLGFALGGFFDGILLHQILQWHHLLSAVEGTDVRFQVAADGWFHALMYVVAAVGLWLLWRARRAGDGRRLVAFGLMGFGAWHVLDSVMSHWLLGIHRIRMDSASPLMWDLLWLAAFGLVPLAVGWWMRRGGRGRITPPPAAAMMALLVVGAGAWAARPPPDSPFTTVLFAPNVSSADAFRAVAGIGGRVVWRDPSGQLVVYEHSEATSPLALYARGAVLVSGAGAPAGCFAWSRA